MSEDMTLSEQVAYMKKEMTSQWQVLELPTGTFGNSDELRIRHVTLENHITMHVSFDSLFSGRGIPPGEYTVFTIEGTPWMSDTPAELADLLPFHEALLKLSPKRVLITGLGLGVAVKMALAAPSVERIDLIEINPHVAEYVGSFWQEEAKKAGKALNITVGDALLLSTETVDPDGGRGWDLAWHDIWPDINHDNVEEMRQLERNFTSQLSLHWASDICEEMYQEICSNCGGYLDPEDGECIYCGEP